MNLSGWRPNFGHAHFILRIIFLKNAGKGKVGLFIWVLNGLFLKIRQLGNGIFFFSILWGNYHISLLFLRSEFRDVAQPGSVHAWGAWGRRFKSCHPDRKGIKE